MCFFLSSVSQVRGTVPHCGGLCMVRFVTEVFDTYNIHDVRTMYITCQF